MPSTPNPDNVQSIAMFLDRASEYTDDQEVFGANVAVADFPSTLLRHGPPAEYSFFQYHDPFTGQSDPREHLTSIAAARTDRTLRLLDISDLKAGRIPFEFGNWHDVDGDFSQVATLRANLSPKLYPISSTFHVLSYPSLLHSWVLRMLLVPSYSCDSIICTSHAAKRALQNLLSQVGSRLHDTQRLEASFDGRLDVIPYAVDVDRFRPRDKSAVRTHLGIPTDVFVILWIGRFSMLDKADLLPLLYVFQDLVVANPEKQPMLLLGGTGPSVFTTMMAELARDLGIADQVRIVSPVPPSIRELYFSAADVFVSPADNVQETLGITPQEAAASGVPQVVSDWDGYRDTVADGRTGFLIPTYMARTDTQTRLQAGLFDRYDLTDHLSIAQATAIDLRRYREALQILLNNEELISEMQQNSRRRALDLFSGEVVIGRHVELWREQREIAAGCAFEPTPTDDYAVPAYFDVFGHYATDLLSGETRVTASPRAAAVLSGDMRLPLLHGARLKIVEGAVLVDLLASVEASPHSISFADMEANRTDMEAVEVRRHIMWLLKYGLVELTR